MKRFEQFGEIRQSKSKRMVDRLVRYSRQIIMGLGPVGARGRLVDDIAQSLYISFGFCSKVRGRMKNHSLMGCSNGHHFALWVRSMESCPSTPRFSLYRDALSLPGPSYWSRMKDLSLNDLSDYDDRDRSFVYVASNPSIDAVKIGRTKKSPESRLKGLWSTGVPTPFQLEYAHPCKDTGKIERTVHRLLGDHGHRTNERREFFDVSPIFAKGAIQHVAT